MSLPPAASAFMKAHALSLPVIQAPMAGVSSPQLAAAVSNSGAIGSLGLGSSDIAAARRMIRETRALTNRPFNANFFCHGKNTLKPGQHRQWHDMMVAAFRQFDAEPPATLQEVFVSFHDNEGLVPMVLEEKPPIVSFHFGLPAQPVIAAMHAKSLYLIASVTCLQEAQAAEKAGMDAIVAQGIEAGGHRGIFDENGDDSALGLMALVPLLARSVRIPVLAAGAIMNGAAIRAALDMGAAAVQMGTAFIGCPESLADAHYRQWLQSDAAWHTVMTRALSGRPARTLKSAFTELARTINTAEVAPYPYAYDMAKQLHKLAKAHGHHGYGAYWAGQGAPLARFMPAADLVETLAKELKSAG